MKTMAIGAFKARFSEVLDEVSRGQPVAIGRGKSKKKVAVIISYTDYAKQTAPRKLGVLEGRAQYRTRKGFKVSDEEFLES